MIFIRKTVTRCVNCHSLFHLSFQIFLEECELFFLNVRHGYNGTINKDEQHQRFLSILQKCDTVRKKILVLDEFVMFLAFYGDAKELRRWSEELETATRVRDSSESLEGEEKDERRARLGPNEVFQLRGMFQSNKSHPTSRVCIQDQKQEREGRCYLEKQQRRNASSRSCQNRQPRRS